MTFCISYAIASCYRDTLKTVTPPKTKAFLMWNGELFVKKIDYIYKTICKSDYDGLTGLFCKPQSDRFNSRKRLLRNHWRKRAYKRKPDLLTEENFEKFGISGLIMKNKRVFSLDSLLDEPFDDFKKRVDDFLESIRPNSFGSSDVPYRYIYYFDTNLKKILYYKITKIEHRISNEYNIVLIPPSHYKNAENLSGIYTIQQNLIYVTLSSSFQSLTLSFTYNMGYSNDLLYGIGLSKSCDRGLPRASKMLLSTNLMTEAKRAELYLYANESESIEINQTESSNREPLYLFKYYKKLKLIYTFLKKTKRLFNGKLSSNIYLNIFFKEFKSFIFMYKKVVEKKKYFVESRKRATAIFLESMVARKSSCYIVHPLFDEISNFIANNERAIASVNLNIKVAQQGVKIHRIFIIESINEIDDFGIETIKKMAEVGIEIKFVFKEEIETIVTSYDFAFPIERDIVLHKERSRKASDFFSINPDETTIVMYANLYREIDERSHKLEKILELKKQNIHKSYMPKENFLFSQDNRVLQKLLKDDGLWYFYSYPSAKNIEEKVWIVQTQFFDNFTLIDAYRNKGQLFIGTNQSIAIKEGDNSKNMTAIVFDNSKISYDILPFARISKSNGVEESMFNFGFLSRKEFSEEEAVKILGDVDRLQLKVDYSFIQRVNGWIGKF